jgi:putative MATE family efflux protein
MVLEMVWESIFAIADIYFVSRLGANAVAVVGLTESLLTIIYAIGIGLSMATTALVARRIGEKQHFKASNAAFQSILVGLFISLLFAIPGFFYSGEILALMGASKEATEEGVAYTAIMLTGNAVIMLLFINNAIFRSAGDAVVSMWVLALANVINLILDPILIFGWGPFPSMGIKGAAIATTIGRGSAVIIQFLLLRYKKGRINILVQNMTFRFKVMLKLIRLSLGGIGQFLISTSSWIIIMRIMAEFGSKALAGYTIGLRVILFSILPSFGMSNAAATLVGQNLGAKLPERAERSVWYTAFANAAFLSAVSIIFLTIPDHIIKIFSTDPEVIKIGVLSLQIVCLGYVFYAIGMVMTQSFNGAGDTFTPTFINFICFWLLEIPLGYFLALTAGFEEKGVLIAITISESMTGVLGFLLFRKGKWKLRKV